MPKQLSREIAIFFCECLSTGQATVGHAAVHLLAVLGLPDDSATAETLKRAELVAADRKADAALRADALELLALAKSDHDAHLLESRLDPQEPDTVQIAAVKALHSVRGPKVGALLLAKWNGMSATVRAEAANTLLSGGSDRVRLLGIAVRAVRHGYQASPRFFGVRLHADHRAHLMKEIATSLASLIQESEKPPAQNRGRSFASGPTVCEG